MRLLLPNIVYSESCRRCSDFSCFNETGGVIFLMRVCLQVVYNFAVKVIVGECEVWNSVFIYYLY